MKNKNHPTISFAKFVLMMMCMSVYSQSHAAVGISEFMASNSNVLFDEDGEPEDWIELYNSGPAPVNLMGWYLTDDASELTKWQIPDVTLAPDSYIVIFASKKDRSISGSELHTNFNLKAGGEYLALVGDDGVTIVDEFAPEYPLQSSNISFGNNTYYPQPTPGAKNKAAALGSIEPVDFSLPHGVYDSPQNLTLTSKPATAEIRYTLDGSSPNTSPGCTPPADGKSWSYEYFEGTWSQVPDFNNEVVVASGTTNIISTEPRLRDSDYGLRFKGCVNAVNNGYYRFETTSDEGSILYVDDVQVVNNDGLHNSESASNEVFLSKGLHRVEVAFFQRGGDHKLSASWVAPMSGATYLTTKDEGKLYDADPSAADVIEFDVDVPASGNFEFRANVQGISDDSDSFWVQLDDGPLWLFETGVTNDFREVVINDAGKNIVPSLTAGAHTLKLFPREDGTRIDYIKVIGSKCDGPCEEQILQAEIESISGGIISAGLVSEPLIGEKWFVYTSPITIDKTTVIRAVAVQDGYFEAKPVTQTYLFLDDVINQSRNEEAPAGWPEGDINNQEMDYGMDPQIVDQNPSAVKQSLMDLPSISIVTDIDNLMHPLFGIYVNAEEKGRDWERPASVELIDSSGNEPGFSINAGIRIRGGYSRRGSNLKHPFRLYFRKSYDGKLKYPLFGIEGVNSFERMDLRSPNNYNWSFTGDHRNTFLRELWSRDTQGAMGQPYTRSRYYHLYINGVYWGLNMTQERVSKEFAESYFGGDEDDYDVVKQNRQDDFRYEASDGINSSWNQLWEYVSDRKISATEYASIDEQVDIENLIDYMIGHGYEGDIDGAPSSFISRWKRANNWYALHNRVPGNQKWVFFQHDGEHTLGVARDPSKEENVLGPFPPFDGSRNEYFSKEYMNPYWLHAALVSNPDYRQRFIERVATHFDRTGVLSTEKALERWYSRKAEVQGGVLAHSARWGDSKRSNPYTVSDWRKEVDYVENNFFPGRTETVFNQLLNLDLASKSVVPMPLLSIPSGSTVDKNTLLEINQNMNEVYYTLDGSDPRDSGGGVSSTAQLLPNGQTILIDSDIHIRMRARSGNNWSGLVIADYYIDADTDSDGDGILDAIDDDDDNDGVLDVDDAFPYDDSESLDSDGDGVGDNADAFPNDPNETVDSDGDGVGDNGDIDTDNDGLVNAAETLSSSGKFKVLEVKASSRVSNLTTADAVIASGGAASTVTSSDTVNLSDNRTDGHFGGNQTFTYNDDFVVRATGDFDVSTAGTYTFGTNSDDGVRVRVDGMTVILDDSTHSAKDRFGQSSLTAGTHSIEVVFFERGGGATLELFMASGAHTRFNAGFTLMTSSAANNDVDGDGIPNERDLDSDNDTIADVVEAGLVDADGNFVVDDLVNDQGTVQVAPDTDSDGIPDFLDPESNNPANDGTAYDIATTAHASLDTNGDGMITLADTNGGTDADGDGIDDLVDANPTQPGSGPASMDSDGDGVPNSQDAYPNDPLRTVPAVSVSDLTVLEDAGNALLQVVLSTQARLPASIDIATSDDSAISGSDYAAVDLTLNFALGETSKSVQIPIMDDSTQEASESLRVDLSNPVELSVDTASATITIQDNDSSGSTDACFEPAFDAQTEKGVFIWALCDGSGEWRMRVTGGGDAKGVSYEGHIESPGGITYTPYSLEGSDALDNSNAELLSYLMKVWNGGKDGIDFIPGDNACLTTTAPDLPVYLGQKRVSITTPFNLTTLSSCGGLPQSAQCGEPTYDRQTEQGLFLWKDCQLDKWYVRLSGGGQSAGVFASGTVTSAGGFTNLSQFSYEANDIFDNTTNPDEIVYRMHVWNAARDGFGFTPSGVDSCFVLDDSIPMYLGEGKQVVDSPLNLDTLASCDIASDPAECGEPTYDTATEPGLYLWKECSATGPDAKWHLRVVGGGLGWSPYSGQLTSTNPVSATAVMLENTDIMDATAGDNGIDYMLYVVNAGTDGLDLTIPANSQTCFISQTVPAGAAVYVGRDKVPQTDAFNLEDLGICQ